MTSLEGLNCIFCQEVFGCKEDLQIHFRKHGDPNFNPNQVKHIPQNETSSAKKNNESGEVGCDVCTEVFPTISKAITHKHKVHPDHDTKYFCPWCGKLFTLKHLYTKHLQANHENAERLDEKTFHCDSCNVDFYFHVALSSHNKFFHRQDELPAIGQSKKLKLYNQEVLQIYYCTFCGEEYENKVNLHKHIKDEHSDENQSPDEILRCPLCDAIFYHLDAYEVHLTFHSTEDMYTEKNELFNDVTEFSLESVPPIYEKVENCEDLESEANAMNIENFLELAMDTQNEDMPKHKKHKKHKKSKKSAITFDEFLNMNKDFFGEGIDFQGVEEVPTQAISKRLKVKRTQNLPKELNPEIEKLKKHGIVIKKKAGQKQVPHVSSKTIKISPEAMKSLKPVVRSGNHINTVKKIVSQDQLNILKKSGKPALIKENAEKLSEKLCTEPIPLNDGLQINEKNMDKNLLPDNFTNMPSKSRSPSPDHDINGKRRDEKITNLLSNDNEDQNSMSERLTAHESENTAKCSQSPYVNKTSKTPNNINSSQDLRTEKLNPVGLDQVIPKEIENASVDNASNDRQSNNENCKEESSTETNLKESQNSSLNNTLSALKHLSHLITVKPVNSPKASPDPQNTDTQTKDDPDNVAVHDESQLKVLVPNTKVQNETISKIQKQDCDKTSSAMRHLGSNITIKSVGQKNTIDNDISEDENDEYKDNEDDIDLKNEDNKSDTDIENEDKLNDSLQPLKMPYNTPKLNKAQIREDTDSGNISNNEEEIKHQSNQDILKKLTNITAKPVKNKSNSNLISGNTPQLHSKTKITTHINEDNIEVFNIEDSDSDEMDNISKNVLKKTEKPNPPFNDALRKVNKNQSVKAMQQQQTINKSKSFTETITQSHIMHTENQTLHSEEFYSKVQDYRQDQAINTNSIAHTAINDKNLAIKNVLKNLGKNITIRSRTSSPSQSIKSQDNNDSQDSNMETKEEVSDNETDVGNVKITELEEDGCQEEIENNKPEHNVTVQSPNSCDSENSDHEDRNGDILDEYDVESQIKTSKLHKNKNNVKQMTKNIKNTMVEPESDNKANMTEETSNEIVPYMPKNLGSQISVKPVKQKLDAQTESIKNVNQVIANTSHQRTPQTNTVNKEVTVKTFQTKTQTVIEEITTTVTKTIKTVKQEMRNTSQCSTSVMVPQKMQAIRPSTQTLKNYQGTKVQNMPQPTPKIRNTTPIRPSISSIRLPNQVTASGIKRDCNQLVPVRPKLNVARLSSPRMPITNKNPPSTSTQSNITGKPLKVSPSAIVPSGIKRVNTDESTGHFSCFKKPKESLIPVSDVSSFGGVNQGNTVQFTSSQMSKSNFFSSTKTVKGNATLTQKKSETSTSSQQLNKLSNMSGLKVFKTSQAKQTVIREKTEVSSPNSNTLEAIEKLQKSGLLVKRPKVEYNEESDHSEHEEDCNPPYDSADEAND